MLNQTDVFQADRLMTHLDVLCNQIGARPTGTRAEFRAAEYVTQVLDSLKVSDVRSQSFRTPHSYGWATIPFTLAAALSTPVGTGGRFGKLIGGLALLSSVLNLRSFMLGKAPLYQPLVQTGQSQNIIARIPPSGETRQMVFIVAHLDSNKQRFMLPQIAPSLTKPLNTLALLLGGLGGASMLIDALRGHKRVSALQGAASAVALLAAVGLIIDEMQPFIEGANDDASGVAVALGIADALAAQPLEHTEVTLLFTGSEETGCTGIEAYLNQYAPPLDDTYFINLDMVGAGDLCYISEHGVSHLSSYRPTPQLTALAAKIARENASFHVTGKPLTILDAVAPLVRRGYEAIGIAGYDESGSLPNWHRTSDTLDKIEPDKLVQAARYTHEMIKALDGRAQ